MVRNFFYLLNCIVIFMLLNSCTEEGVYDYNRSKIYGIWTLDSFIQNKKDITGKLSNYKYEFRGDDKLVIQSKDTSITANCNIFNSAYTNYIIISQITDSGFIHLNKKWFIGKIGTNDLRLDNTDLDLKIDESIYFKR